MHERERERERESERVRVRERERDSEGEGMLVRSLGEQRPSDETGPTPTFFFFFGLTLKFRVG